MILLIIGSITKSVLQNIDQQDVVFSDNDIIISSVPKRNVQPKVGLPKVFAPSAMNELMFAAAEKRRLAEEKLCENEAKIYECYLLRPRTIRVNITKFGGSWDRVVKYKEKGSVGGNRLRSLNDREDLYVAWPMPNVSDKSSKSPLDIPSVEHYFGNHLTSLSKRIETANKSLKDYMVEITHRSENGEVKTVLARIEDRGPAVATRFDASRAVWEKLGLEEVLKGSPNSKDNRVTLGIRLVPKQSDDAEMQLTLTAEAEAEEAQLSAFDGEQFLLPSWEREDDNNTIASNP